MSARSRRPRSQDDAGVAARRVALDALERVDADGAYANLVTNALLDRSDLDERDRRFVTELVYGTTRMRRACDHLVARHRDGGVTPRVAAALRLGAYQLGYTDVPAHAAVDATVGAAPKPARGLVNAVLRRVAADLAPGGVEGIEWPDDATRLSYPDWVVGAVGDVLGTDAPAALEAMNRPATTHVRADGYVQDLASQDVVAEVGARPGERVLDLCAAPGGKATGMAASGAHVVAADSSPARAGLVVANAASLGRPLPVLVADGTAAPFADGSFDRVLVDAPCSGLGVLRRRPDARWRIEATAPARLADLQRRLLAEAARVVAPGGTLVYSVCTLTRAEGDDVAATAPLGPGFEPTGRRVLVPDDERDGMFVATWRRTP